MARRKAKNEKPRHRVKWPKEARVQIDVVVHQTDKPAAASKPKQDPDKIPTRITDHRTGEVKEVTGGPVTAAPTQSSLALTPQEIEASQAKVREIMRNLAAGVQVEVTPEPEDQSIEHRSAPPLGASGYRVKGAELKPPITGEATLADARATSEKDVIDSALAQSAKPEPRHHIQTRDEDGKATSPVKEATLAARKDQVKADLRAEQQIKQEEGWFQAIESIGILWAFRLFFGVIGAGAGSATIYFAVSKMLSQ